MLHIGINVHVNTQSSLILAKPTVLPHLDRHMCLLAPQAHLLPAVVTGLHAPSWPLSDLTEITSWLFKSFCYSSIHSQASSLLDSFWPICMCVESKCTVLRVCFVSQVHPLCFTQLSPTHPVSRQSVSSFLWTPEFPRNASKLCCTAELCLFPLNCTLCIIIQYINHVSIYWPILLLLDVWGCCQSPHIQSSCYSAYERSSIDLQFCFPRLLLQRSTVSKAPKPINDLLYLSKHFNMHIIHISL